MTPLTVFKLGGSLLDLPDLPSLVRRLRASRPERNALFVVGGGAAADVVRQWDRIHGLGDESSHELALEAMGLNESLIAHLCPELRLVRSGPQLEMAFREGVPALLCAACFVRWGESRGTPLPRSWDVTSDSIAAWTAAMLQAEELVLVKSAPCPAPATLKAIAEAGLVDLQFSKFAAGVPRIVWENGRNPTGGTTLV